MQDRGPALARSALRWLVVFAVMAVAMLVLSLMAMSTMRSIFQTSTETEVSFPENEAAEEEQVVTPVEDGQAAPLADMSVRAGAVAQAAEPVLDIGGEQGDALLLSFQLIEGDPQCLATAELEIQLLEATPAQLVVHPAAVTGVPELADGGALPDPLLADETAGGVAITDGSPGRLRWDITDLYRRYATGAIAGAPQGEFALVVKAAEDPAALRARFAALESSATEAPLLVWTGVAGCGA